MRLRPLALAVTAATTAIAVGVTAPAALGADVPGVSRNVDLVYTVPTTGGTISGTFAHTGNFFYTSEAGGLNVFDTSNPRMPKLVGKVVQGEFENEAMTYAERDRNGDGKLERYVFVGNDLVQATIGGTDGPAPAVGNRGGREIVVFDVTDATKPREIKRVRTLTSTHTLQCVTVACDYAYTAGGTDNRGTASTADDLKGRFSIIDFRDMATAKEATVDVTGQPPAAKGQSPAAKGPFAAGHYDTAPDPQGRRIGWHTGGGGAAAFDVTNPLSPVLLNSTDPRGTSKINANQNENYNDFILHNSMRPNAGAFVAGTEGSPSVSRGNVLVATEEDYFNDGEEVACSRSGSIETWAVPSLGGQPADADTGSGTIAPLDKLNPVEGIPGRGFCSAHWFDYHQDGFLAQGFYQGGLQIIDVRDARDLKSYGFFMTPAATEVWDAYWVPVRDAAGVDTGRKTDLVYTADLVKGLDVFDVRLPNEPVAPGATVPEVPLGVVLPLAAAVLLGGAVAARRRRAATGAA